MWGEPRKGTEAYIVKEEVRRRQKAAQDKKLDQLLIDAYYDCLKYYPSWIKDARNRKWVESSVSEAIAIGDKYSPDVEFKVRDKTYKVTRGDRWVPEFGEGTWHKLTHYSDSKQLFAVTEEETSDEYSSYHRPISVDAYTSEEWVSDFQKIVAYKKKVDVQTEIEFAENPKRTQELKKAFGIDQADFRVTNEDQIFSSSTLPQAKKDSVWSKWWIWVIAILFFLIFISS